MEESQRAAGALTEERGPLSAGLTYRLSLPSLRSPIARSQLVLQGDLPLNYIQLRL